MTYSNAQVVGNISSEIGELTSEVLQEIYSPTPIPINKMFEAAETDPYASACILVTSARASQLIDVEYHNEDSKIKKFINDSFNSMKNTKSEIASVMSSAVFLGFGISEVAFKKERYKWDLDKVHFLHPCYSTFRVHKGNPIDVKYHDNGVQKYIPMWKCLHVVGGLPFSFGSRRLYGSGQMIRAYPYIKLKQLIMSQMGVSGKTRATGLIVGKTKARTTVPLLDKLGKPMIDPITGKPRTISSSKNLAMQLSNIATNGHMVIGADDDITSLTIPAGENFWNLAITILNSEILRSFLTPDTIWSQGVTVFGSGAANTQLNILDSQINNVVTQVKDQLIEKIIKKIILWNFGSQSNYGKFEEKSLEDKQQDQVITGNLLQAMSMGIIPSNDTDAMNKIRDLLKLPGLSEEQIKLTENMNNSMQQLSQATQNINPAQIQNIPVEQQQAY